MREWMGHGTIVSGQIVLGQIVLGQGEVRVGAVTRTGTSALQPAGRPALHRDVGTHEPRYFADPGWAQAQPRAL
jgi:hypothetical protein